MPTADASLAGIRVLVTRPAAQASELLRRVREAGGEPVAFPTLIIEPVVPVPARVEPLAGADMIIFISPNAVAHGYGLLRDADAVGRVFAIGRGTAQALRDRGCPDVATPPEPHSTESLAASPLLDHVADRDICVVRGQGGREALKDVLTARGARVTYVECYRRRPPSDRDLPILVETLDAPRDALVISVTSVTGLVNLLDAPPKEYVPRLLSRPLVVIGDRQRAAAVQRGWTGPVLEAGAGDAEIVNAITAWRRWR